MGVITISLKDEIERKLRRLARARYSGQKKGQLSSAITDAIEDWTRKDEQQEIMEESVALLDEGFNMGRLKVKERAKWHER